MTNQQSPTVETQLLPAGIWSPLSPNIRTFGTSYPLYLHLDTLLQENDMWLWHPPSQLKKHLPKFNPINEIINSSTIHRSRECLIMVATLLNFTLPHLLTWPSENPSPVAIPVKCLALSFLQFITHASITSLGRTRSMRNTIAYHVRKSLSVLTKRELIRLRQPLTNYIPNPLLPVKLHLGRIWRFLCFPQCWWVNHHAHEVRLDPWWSKALSHRSIWVETARNKN